MRKQALAPDLRCLPVSDPEAAASQRILLAEDDTELRALIAVELRQDGYEVIEAADGAELLDWIESSIRANRRDYFAAIVSDIRMPGLSGLDVLAALHCAYWVTPVILITAFGDPETHAEARELGAVAVFDKPFDLAELRRALSAVVSR